MILVLMNLQSVKGTKYLARHWRRFKTIVRLEVLLFFASTDVPVRTISLFGSAFMDCPVLILTDASLIFFDWLTLWNSSCLFFSS